MSLPDSPSGDPPSTRPELRRTRDALTLQFAGSAAVQSSMSLLNPYALELDYTRLMMGFLLFDSAPRRMLMIGLGGGSLAKFCHRYLPGTSIDVVEIDPEVIALRDAFHVPPDDGRFRVIAADGRLYLQEPRAGADLADVLLVDAYDGRGMPPALCERAFFEDCRTAMSSEGILVVNLHFESATYPVCLAHLREVFGASLFEVVDDDMTNSIVFARKGEPFDDVDLAAALRKPAAMAKDAWRQLLPTFRLIEATLTLR
ncbi:fused MFS/spermidine synthase [Bordetella genomosp. 13]|uniref:PABS domain-containing protein n=1 Tax=Bordetella genomosp. 13 TaxID=463040 RepID=A0A1W6ZGQ5_9BORD|nr:fused MFS/spermidine synthase [Bordetella genomosp. 13]ARP96546.1 hypothetical protein CAL15_20580 [Bordetella genomosp. 13]